MNNTEANQLLSSKETAAYLQVTVGTLRTSRTKGMLFGTEAPIFTKRGNKCWYKKADLDKWLQQFKSSTSTGAIRA